jgi:hypothetical protein
LFEELRTFSNRTKKKKFWNLFDFCEFFCCSKKKKTFPEVHTLLRIQFRHVLGVQFVKVNARHKLERLHLVGSTRDEAVHLANGQKQQNSHHWNPYTDCPSRYSNNYGRGSNYQSWYDFRQSSRYFSV